MGSQPTQVDCFFAYLRKDRELTRGFVVDDEAAWAAEVRIRDWDFFGDVREEAKREHLDRVMLVALSREAIQGDIYAIDRQSCIFLTENVRLNDHNIFDGDVIDGLFEMTINEYDIGLAICLQVRSIDNTKNVFAELEDITDITVLLKLHDFVMLKKRSVV